MLSSRQEMLRDAGYDPRQSVADLMSIATTSERDRDRIRAHELLLKLAGAFEADDGDADPRISISTERLLALEAMLVAGGRGAVA